MLWAAATGGAQEEADAAFVASALGVPQASVRLDGSLNPVTAADAQLFRVGGGEPGASRGIVVERGAYAAVRRNDSPSADLEELRTNVLWKMAAFDCARPTVACPPTELQLERFDAGGHLFLWDLAGAVERPTGSQILRVAVLAHDPSFPLPNDTRPNSPFTRVNKIWVMDLTETAETMRYFQMEGGQLRESRNDAIAGFNADRGFTVIAGTAFAGVTAWNIHTYLLAGAGEGGHALVPPGRALLPVTGPTIHLGRNSFTLEAGCSQVTPAATESAAAYAARVTPQGALAAIWEHQAANNTFRGFSPIPGSDNDLAGVTRLRPVWICTEGAATLDGSAAVEPPTPAAEVPATTPRPPMRLYGTIAVNLAPAEPLGTNIEAFINGIKCGQGSIATELGQGSIPEVRYSLQIDPAVIQPGCGIDGVTVQITVNGVPAGMVRFEHGVVTELPLSVLTESTAAPVASYPLSPGCSQVTPAVTAPTAEWADRVILVSGEAASRGGLSVWDVSSPRNPRVWTPDPDAPNDLDAVTREQPAIICVPANTTLDATAVTGPPVPVADLPPGTPTPPMRLYGAITVGGVPAPVGTSISATIDQTACGEATVTVEGSYVIDVRSAATQAGCGVDLSTVEFKVVGLGALLRGPGEESVETFVFRAGGVLQYAVEAPVLSYAIDAPVLSRSPGGDATASGGRER
jgi:hypothetical protein